MNAKLTLTKPGESWGEPGSRTHTQDSELVADAQLGWITFSIKSGAVNATGNPERSRPAEVAGISLTREDARTLAAFLTSLPEE